MRAAAMSRIKISGADTHDDEALCKPHFSSLLEGRRISFRVLRVLSGGARLMTIWLNQEAGGVYHAVDIRATLEATRHPPPGRYNYI